MEWIPVSSSQNRLHVFLPDSEHKSYPVELSVVIPTFNRADRLTELLNCWLKVDAATTVKYELIFCDDGSEDETVKILKSYQNQLPMQILANSHAGPAEARNSGIEAARGRRLLFLGDDIYPGTDLLNLHVRLGEELGDHVAIQGRVDWHPEQKQNHLLTHITEIGHEQFCFDQMPENSFVDYSHFYTCNVSVSSSLLSLESIKFDTRFYKVNFEDIELAYRLSSHGMQVFYAPSAHALHFHEYDVEGFSRRQETAGEMAYVFGVLHTEWDRWLGLYCYIDQYHNYLQVHGIQTQPQRQLPLVYQCCHHLEAKLKSHPDDDRLRKILSLVYLQLFKFKFIAGYLTQLEAYDKCSVEHFLYELCFGHDYYDGLERLVLDQLRDENELMNGTLLVQYYRRLLHFKLNQDDIRLANELISETLPAELRNWMVRPGLKKLAKKKTRAYLSQKLRFSEVWQHAPDGNQSSQEPNPPEHEQVQVTETPLAMLPVVNSLPRVAILSPLSISSDLIQDYQRELGASVLFLQKTDNGFQYQLEGATGVTTDLDSVHFDYILQVQNESELPLIFHIKNVLISLACSRDDYALISYSYEQGPTVGVQNLAAQLFLKRSLFFSPESLTTDRGCFLRLLPAPEGVQENSLEDLFAADSEHLQAINPNLKFNFGQPAPKIPSVLNLEHLRAPNDKPVVFVFPIIMAVGGAERNIIAVMQELQAKYHFVVITFDPHTSRGGSLHHQVQQFTDDIYDFAEIARVDDYLDLLQAFKRQFDPKLILVTNESNWFVSNSQKIRQIFQDVPIVDHQVYDQQAGWIQHYTDPGIQSFDRFVAINRKIESVMQTEKGISQERIRHIYHAVDTARIREFKRSKFDAATVCRKYGLPAGVDKYIHIARQTYQKRPLAFLEMVRSLQDAGRSECFIMVGDGDLRGDVDAYISTHQLKNVAHIPFVNNPLELIAVSRGMIFTSAFEGLPVAMLEALTLGVPVFSTDVGDIKVVLDEYQAGFTFPVEFSVREAVWYFHQFLAQRDRYAASLSQVKDQIIDRFSAETVSSQYDDLFQDCIQLKRAA
ncbi:glycosyltransferase [Gimesia benthica]|uniref:Glycosyltransferase n=1 Tax=Gimesia benthica TaxID=2608982 RepID=A0A6I6AGB6_9PLAN|nr:glycosyltransferase [Gimesia benthica]QGQ25397.1 glycosyltransferase [Gimesia benthica]